MGIGSRVVAAVMSALQPVNNTQWEQEGARLLAETRPLARSWVLTLRQSLGAEAGEPASVLRVGIRG